MKKFTFINLLIGTLLAFGFSSFGNRVTDIIANSPDHKILQSALVEVNLVDDLEDKGPFTVFAPTDAAFEALPTGLLETLLNSGRGPLTDFLLFHVAPGKAMSSDLSSGQMITAYNDKVLTINIDETGVYINNAKVTVKDIEADNGVVHVIDAIILEPGVSNTIVDIATGNDAFTSLVAALTREDLTTDFISTLKSEGPFTVFAPTNAAFAALLTELGVSSLMDIDAATLEAVLKLHVISAKVLSGDLSEGLMANTLNGEALTFSLKDGAKVYDLNYRQTNISSVDNLALNGVVHIVDRVLLPDMRPATVVDIATGNNAFTSLVAALTREDLSIDFVAALTGEGPFTVFAPTNAAFSALLTELGVASLMDIDVATLEAVLQMHVVSGKVMSGDLSEGMMATTLLGEKIMFSLEGGAKIMDKNNRISNITGVDLMAQNGVVHIIDKVILPDLRPATVVDIATGNDAFTSLVAALTREDLTIDFVAALTGEGPFTVFAPTNAAFAALLSELGVGSLMDIDVATLEAVLQMHVVTGKVMSGDLGEGLKAETLLGEEIMFSLEDGAKIMDPNGRTSNITSEDMEAQNGVVHIIDTVILPKILPVTVVDIATGNDAFTSLVAALTREDLTIDFVAALTGEGPFTVFAPTNDAFAALLSELGVASLMDIDVATLEAVLQMHVVAGKVMAGDLSEGMMATTLLGEKIMFSLEGGAKIMDKNDRTINITGVDVEAQNGVVHIIDKVILPDLRPATVVDIATGNDAFTSLVAALTREDLSIDFVAALTGEGPFTVFAPTNAAFADLLTELGVASLMDIDVATLEAVLQMHVVSGKVMSGDLSEGMMATTLLGEEIMFSLEGGAKIMDKNDRTINITGVDVEAQNGVVHIIDKVILPKQVPTSIEIIEELDWKVFPNPANDFIQIETDTRGALRIRDIMGRLLEEKIIETSVERISLETYKSGIYFVSLQKGESISTRKLIIR